MRVLLDESLPRRLGRELTGHTVRTVVQMGWSGIKNGSLLQRAAVEFDVFLTADQNLPHQQNVKRLPLAVIVLVARNNRLRTLRPLAPKILEAVVNISRGELRHVAA